MAAQATKHNHHKIIGEIAELREEIAQLKKDDSLLLSRLEHEAATTHAATSQIRKSIKTEITERKVECTRLLQGQETMQRKGSEVEDFLRKAVADMSLADRAVEDRCRTDIWAVQAAMQKFEKGQSEASEVLIKEVSVLKAALETVQSATRAAVAGVEQRLRVEFSSGITHAPPETDVGLDSFIISSMPVIFNEFTSKTWRLLYRGSRDGYRAQDFHRKCDNHKNTLTVILDTHGYIFGGYTAIEWCSARSKTEMYDRDMNSFLFTLRNPWDTIAKKFSLRPDGQKSAIVCYSEWGPTFGKYDLWVGDKSDQVGTLRPYNSTTDFGTCYTNSTTHPGGAVFTGESGFCVKDIEVFELE
jgi:hypothetical protein